MSNIVKLIIDGKEIEAKKGDTILEAARRNGHYIPTMCYLPKVNPISSCRICVVEIEGMDGNILSCQEKVIDGVNVTTNSDELFKHRQNIMKMYDVNHPLQCGVCPKSGECDLQNKTMELGVTTQNFTARDQKRDMEDWGYITYDPSLCILCERCVRVSNEIVGDGALEIKVGGYSSTIINPTNSKSINLGECAAVCPVGALSDKDFKFKTNAWEQKRIPASCIHSPLANLIYYEVKRDKIYRVRSEYEFDSISGICRYGYSFENRGSNSKSDMIKTVEAFNNSDTIKFTSLITNEEALILQRLKEKFGFKLINEEARKYQNFLKAFSTTSGKELYSGTSTTVKNSDFIITLGSRTSDDIPVMKFKINEAVKQNNARFYFMHPIADASLKGIVSSHIKYEVGSEEGVLALVLKTILINNSDISDEIKTFIDSLDDGYLSAESNVGEEELEKLAFDLKGKQSPSLLVGSDLYAHPQATNIAKMLGIIERYSNFNVTIIPSLVNTVGVALICDLDEQSGERSVGYNTTGDFILSAIKDSGDVNMPALNQQEGTFTNLDKKVVPTNVVVPFDGFCLNDIACFLGVSKRYTIDYTSELPSARGYIGTKFDHLTNMFSSTGEELRGYTLEQLSCEVSDTLDEITDIDSYDGIVVYSCNPNNQKNIFSNECEDLENDGRVVGSPQFAIAARVSDSVNVEFEINGLKIEKEFKIDKNLKGTIALLPNFDLGFEGQGLFSMYRYNKIKLKQVN